MMERFEEGQISGPYGPKFFGYGEAPKPSLGQVAREVVGYGVLIALGALWLMLIMGAL